MEGTDQRKRKRARLEDEDRISELPDEILVSILSRLTLRQAGRTSVLSKRWRYLWACISVLNFDAKVNKIVQHNPIYGKRRRYIERVSSVLARHRGPNVEEFKVCYKLDNAHGSYIDEWIEFALLNRVHTIELNLSQFRSRCPPGCYYTLQIGVLMRLSCALGFKSLKTLSLEAVNVDDEAIKFFLFNCPLLEQLSLHLNSALRNLKVIGLSLMLRYLEVVRCRSIETIEICDTNLVSFTYVGNMPKMLFKNVPQLVKASINPYGFMTHVQTMFPKVSCYIPQLEILQLKIHHARQERLSDYMLPRLKNLKQFILVVDRSSNDSSLGFLLMIKNWPNLRRFVLQLRSSHKHDEERKEAREDVREAAMFCHACLEVVEIKGYCNICDFELFKQIIKNAVTLEKIIMDIRDPNRDSESEKSYEELERSTVVKHLRAQVPSRVKLLFKN